MKYSFASTVTLSIGILALAGSSALAQTTVFSDDFATDASDPTGSYLLGVSGGTESWTSGTGITLSGSAGGKLEDLIGSFSTVALANSGDYVSFVVNFNSPNIANTGANSGDINFALDNTGGTAPGTGTEAVSSSSTGGTTAGYLGYFGNIGFNSTPKTSSKMFARTGGPNNNLDYSSNVSSKAQVGANIAGGSNATLVNSDSYTLTYTITALNTGASQLQITEQVYDNTLNSMVDNFTTPATNGPAVYDTPSSSFNAFDIGLYTGSAASGYNLNVSEVQVLTDVTASPEPTVLALGSSGLVLLSLIRFRRRN